MTPAAHWSPDDYYRASRGARAAWERQDHQLTLAAEESGFGDTLGERSAAVAPDHGMVVPTAAKAARTDETPSAASVSILSDSPALAMLGGGRDSRGHSGCAAPTAEHVGLDTDEVKRAASYAGASTPVAAAASSVSSPPVDASLSRRAGSLPPEERSL